MTISYNLNIPDGPNNPSVDQPKMKTNTNNISQIIGIDHVTFDDATNPNGYHTVIHQTLQGLDPAAIVGINQLYSKNATITNSGGSTTDTQLFTRTGLGGVSQLTGNHSAANGYSFISGVILQWGVVTLPGTSNPTGTVNFNTAPNFNFPTDTLNIQLTLQANVTTGQVNSIAVLGTPTKFGFNWVFSGSTSFNKFYWFAIGN